MAHRHGQPLRLRRRQMGALRHLQPGRTAARHQSGGYGPHLDSPARPADRGILNAKTGEPKSSPDSSCSEMNRKSHNRPPRRNSQTSRPNGPFPRFAGKARFVATRRSASVLRVNRATGRCASPACPHPSRRGGLRHPLPGCFSDRRLGSIS